LVQHFSTGKRLLRINDKVLQYHTETDDLSTRDAKFVQKQHIRQKLKIIQNLQILTKNTVESFSCGMKNFYQFIGVHFTILNLTHLLRIDSKIKNFVVIVVKICNYWKNYCFNVFRNENLSDSRDMAIRVITKESVLI
jgi:hypothetical protein